MEGTCSTCKYYGNAAYAYPCCICADTFDKYEPVSDKTCKYDIKIFYKDSKIEIFDADKVEFLGTVLVISRKGHKHYYPIYQIIHYEIIEKEVL